MKTFWLLTFSSSMFFIFLNPVAAQVSSNIAVNSALVDDLQQAADYLDLDGAVIVGDTITVENDIQLNGLSLFFVCHHLKSTNKSITLNPFKQDSITYAQDGRGHAGPDVSIYSTGSVQGKFTLTGGKGKSGRNGVDGKSGKKPNRTSECCGEINLGKKGENGQNGYDGGNGGKLTLKTIVPKEASSIHLLADGGEGGDGGLGGKGGTSYRELPNIRNPRDIGGDEEVSLRITELHEKDGKPGSAGKMGNKTALDFTQITPEDFRKELKKYGVDSISNGHAAFTTLISLQPRRIVRPSIGTRPPITTVRRTIN